MRDYIFILLIFCCTFLQSQIMPNNNYGTVPTSYTNGATNNSIFIWCGTGNEGSLTYVPSAGTPPYTFNWFSYSSSSFSWVNYSSQSGAASTINNLPSGGYRVEVYSSNGALVNCDNAWVWNVNNQTTANNSQVTCSSVNLTASSSINTTFTYYNPPPPQSIINAGTNISVCFTGKHTWVSDLGFYLIGPSSCGSPVITLSPNPGSIGQGNICNGGNDFNNLCFTNVPSPNFNLCKAATPMTGSYDSYGPGTGTNINWSPLIGCNAAQGGWRVQVFDCITLDYGTFTNATITFSNLTSICGSPTSISYNSGTINSAINDGSCSQATASIYQVPPPSNLTTPISLIGTVFRQWTSAPAVTISNPSLINTTASNITTETVFTLSSTFNVGGSPVCISDAQTTFTPTVLTANYNSSDPICYNNCNGTASATPTSGTSPYNYSWNPNGNTQTITNLCEGTYTVTVTDANGCKTSGSVTLSNPSQITLSPIGHN